jgi:hypothetical protein
MKMQMLTNATRGPRLTILFHIWFSVPAQYRKSSSNGTAPAACGRRFWSALAAAPVLQSKSFNLPPHTSYRLVKPFAARPHAVSRLLASRGSAAAARQAVYKHSIRNLRETKRRPPALPCQSRRHRRRHHRELRVVSFGQRWMERRRSSRALAAHVRYHMARRWLDGNFWIQVRNVNRIAQVQQGNVCNMSLFATGLPFNFFSSGMPASRARLAWPPDGRASASLNSLQTQTVSRSTGALPRSTENAVLTCMRSRPAKSRSFSPFARPTICWPASTYVARNDGNNNTR